MDSGGLQRPRKCTGGKTLKKYIAGKNSNIGSVGSGRVKSNSGSSSSKPVDKPSYSNIKIDFKSDIKASVPSKEELKLKYNLTVDEKIKAFEPLETDKGKNLGFRMELEDKTVIEYSNERDLGRFNGSNPTITKDTDGRLLFKGLRGPNDALKIQGGESLFTFQNCGLLNFKSSTEGVSDDIILKSTNRATFDLGGGEDKVHSEKSNSNRIIKTGGSMSSSGEGENVFIGDFDKNGKDDRYENKKSENAEKAKQIEKENKHIFRNADFPKK